jgi:putative Mg2+ transporter-C (MgtC) family protein
MKLDFVTIERMLHELNWLSLIARTALSLLIGGVLGYERGKKNHPAGFRTYMLVCFGAALVMMTNQFVFQQWGASDPTRLGAQVISGIGFLGAGSIIISGRSHVRGITTAAGLWAAACGGLAVGIGFYSGAFVAVVAIYLILAFFHPVDERIHRHSHSVSLYLELDRTRPLSAFLNEMRQNHIIISDFQVNKAKFTKEKLFCVTGGFRCKSLEKDAIVETVKKTAGVKFLEEL